MPLNPIPPNSPVAPNSTSLISICRHHAECSGCQLWEFPYELQQLQKKEHLQKLLEHIGIKWGVSEISFLSCGDRQLRTRLDFSLRDGVWGLYHKHSNRELVNIETCLQLDPALQKVYSEFRKIPWPVHQGSLRLRVGPRGEIGVWLDFSNRDIKFLLDEKTTLNSVRAICGSIEMGQRRKTLTSDFKLVESQLHEWFQTWIRVEQIEKSFPLYCSIGSFTQPGPKPNYLMTTTLMEWLQQGGTSGAFPTELIEFGCGIGNLTIPALSLGMVVTVYENDRLSLLALKRNFQNFEDFYHQQNLKISFQLRIQTGDFQNKKNLSSPKRAATVLVNPPRSGLKDFLDFITEQVQPGRLIYISCYPESFSGDAQKLLSRGYELREIKILDQFPQTHHYEIMAFFVRH